MAAVLPIVIDPSKAQSGAAAAKAAIDEIKNSAAETEAQMYELDTSLATVGQQGAGQSEDLLDVHHDVTEQMIEQTGLQEEISRITGDVADQEAVVENETRRVKNNVDATAKSSQQFLAGLERIAKVAGLLQIAVGAVNAGIALGKGLTAAMAGNWEDASVAIEEAKKSLEQLPFGIGQFAKLGDTIGEAIFGDAADAEAIKKATKEAEEAQKRRLDGIKATAEALKTLARIEVEVATKRAETIKNSSEKASELARIRGRQALQAFDEQYEKTRGEAARSGAPLTERDEERFRAARAAIESSLAEELAIIKKGKEKISAEQRRALDAEGRTTAGILAETEASRLRQRKNFLDAEILTIRQQADERLAATREALRAVLEADDIEVDPRITQEKFDQQIKAIEAAREAAIEVAKEKEAERIEPLSDLLTSMKDEVALLKLGNREREIAKAQIEALKLAEKLGLDVTKEQLLEIGRLVDEKRKLEEDEKTKSLSFEPSQSVAVSDRFRAVSIEFRSQQQPMDRIVANTKSTVDILKSIDKKLVPTPTGTTFTPNL